MFPMTTPRPATKGATRSAVQSPERAQPSAEEEYRADVAAYVAAGGDESVQRVITAVHGLARKLDQWYRRQCASPTWWSPTCWGRSPAISARTSPHSSSSSSRALTRPTPDWSGELEDTQPGRTAASAPEAQTSSATQPGRTAASAPEAQTSSATQPGRTAASAPEAQ